MPHRPLGARPLDDGESGTQGCTVGVRRRGDAQIGRHRAIGLRGAQDHPKLELQEARPVAPVGVDEGRGDSLRLSPCSLGQTVEGFAIQRKEIGIEGAIFARVGVARRAPAVENAV